MATRTYGQYCGLAHAMELVGERWAMLIVRDLLTSPKRFTDLRNGLPRIPTNILSARLKELEGSGIVRRRLLPRPERGVVYELTEYGAELDDVLLRLGLWGARSLGHPRPDDIVTPDSMRMALRATFRCDAARELGASATFELRLGPVVFHTRVHDGTVETGEGPADAPDLVIETGPVIRALLQREITAEEALAGGGIHITGDRALFDQFVELFEIPPAPAPGSARN